MSDTNQQFLDRLTALGVPIFTTSPGTTSEYKNRHAWQHTKAEDNAEVLDRRQAADAVRGVMGGRVAVVDVDTKNGADPDKVRALLDDLGVRVYADVLTPSGGRHYYVAGHADLATIHAQAGRDGLDGLPGVEVLSFGTNVFLPGTQRPKYDGAGYVVLSDDLDELQQVGVDEGKVFADWCAEHRARRPAEVFDVAPAWTGAAPDRRQAAYLAAALRGMHERIAGTGDGGRNMAVYEAAMACGNYIAGAGMDEADAVRTLLDAAAGCGLVADDGERAVLATIRSGIRNGKVRPRAVPPARDGAPASRTTSGTTWPSTTSPARAGADDSDPRRLLVELLTDLRGWHHLPDPSHVVLTLAAATTRNAEGEPCWLLLVAPPSSGKTEAVRLLDAVTDDRLDEVTAAGLLGWSKGKEPKPSGVLARASETALVTIGDLSTLLATSDRGGRDQVFALLRRAYDGHVTRDVSPPGRVPGTGKLSWSGRLTVVGCVTGAIDRAAAHSDALGPRWLYVRLPERDTAAKRQAARLARAGGLAERRAQAAARAAEVVHLAAGRLLDDVDDETALVIEDAALVTTWGRAAVPRNGYGRREIEGVPVIEEPMRLVQQLGALGHGLTALGLPEAGVRALVRRVALDSMPEARRAVLAALATGEVLTTSGLARVAGLDRKVARMVAEELAAVGVVEHDRVDDEDDDLAGPVSWSLAGEDGELIAAVFGEHVRGGGWDEMWVYTSTSPPIEEEREDNTRFQPTFRPTLDPVIDDIPAGHVCPSCSGPISADRATLELDCLDCYDRQRKDAS